MKDKEKIEEMPICVNCIHVYVCEEYNLNRDMLRKRCAYHNDHFVDIKHYQPKLPKDSVVLTEREHEIAMVHQYDVGFGFGYKKGSKETAEKILQIIDFIDKKYQNYAKEKLQSSMVATAFKTVINEIKIELAKEFGIKIKE